MTTPPTTPATQTPTSRRAPSMPRARGARGARGGPAPVSSSGTQLLQRVLLWAGAVLLPLGLVVIGLGWYGVAHTPYTYDQLSYLVSGGLLGIGITVSGGFLYFGSWLARIAADQREASRRLADTLLELAEATSRSSTGTGGPEAVASGDPGAVPVLTPAGDTVHRADCELLAGREDLRPAGPDAAGLTRCRLCRPSLDGR